MPKKDSFEEKLAQLEELVLSLERGDLTLQKSIEAYEKGCKLRLQLEKILSDGEYRIRILNEQGEEEPFHEENRP